MQETDPEKDSKAAGNVTRLNAGDLEHENMEWHLNNLYIPISEDRTVQISVDGDCKIKKLIREIENENFEIELYFDQAHMGKNIPKNVTAIVKAHGYFGSGDGRICVAAAALGAKSIGYEIDPCRVSEAKKAAKEAGVSERCNDGWTMYF